jgi:hypothetical protein
MLRSSEKKTKFVYPPRWARILGISTAGDDVPESGDDQRCGDSYIEDGLDCHQGGGAPGTGLIPEAGDWIQDDPSEDSMQAYRQKTTRRPRGQGGVVALTSMDVQIALTQGKYALLSAGRNPNNAEDMQLTDEQISVRSQALQQDLVNSGYMFTPSIGRYGGETEDSYLVMAHEAETQEVIALGQKYNQDSIIAADGGNQQMIYTTGPNAGQAHVGSGFEALPDEAPEYTRIETEDGRSVKFSLNFDWDQLHQVIANLFRRVRRVLV